MLHIGVGLLVVLVVGAAVVVWGWRGRRVNDHPVCRDCGFDLSGVVPEGVTCPECGGGLKRAKGVRIGQRRKRPVAIGAGALLTLVPAVVLAGVMFAGAFGVDLNAYKPVWLLAWEGERGASSAVEALASELERRSTARTLGQEDIERACEAILKIQRIPGVAWDRRLGDFVVSQAYRGKLDEEIALQLRVQGVDLVMKARRRVAAGGVLAVEANPSGFRAGKMARGNVMVWIDRATIGGRVADRTDEARRTNLLGTVQIPSHSNLGLRLDASDICTMLRVDPDLEPGRHMLRVEMFISPESMTFHAEPDIARAVRERGVEHLARAVTLEAEILVEAAGTPVVEIVDPTPEDDQAIAETLGKEVSGRVFGAESMVFLVRDDMILPAPVVGQVYASWQGHEWAVGGVTVRGGDPLSGGFSETTSMLRGPTRGKPPPGFDADRVRVRIVPDVQRALETTNITRVYGGEIVLENVEVHWMVDKPARADRDEDDDG